MVCVALLYGTVNDARLALFMHNHDLMKQQNHAHKFNLF